MPPKRQRGGRYIRGAPRLGLDLSRRENNSGARAALLGRDRRQAHPGDEFSGQIPECDEPQYERQADQNQQSTEVSTILRMWPGVTQAGRAGPPLTLGRPRQLPCGWGASPIRPASYVTPSAKWGKRETRSCC